MNEERIDIECDSLIQHDKVNYYNINLNLDENIFDKAISKFGLTIISKDRYIKTIAPDLHIINHDRKILDYEYMTWLFIEYKGYTAIFYVYSSGDSSGGITFKFICKNNKVCTTKSIETSSYDSQRAKAGLIRSIRSKVVEGYEDNINDLIDVILYICDFCDNRDIARQLNLIYATTSSIMYGYCYQNTKKYSSFEVYRCNIPIYIKIKPDTVISL